MLRAPRTLSSPDTFIMKVLPMALCFAFTAVEAFRVLVKGASVLSLVWLILASVLFYLLCGRLKAVQMDESSLYVSNYIHEIEVHLRDVVAVYEYPWPGLRTVSIKLSAATAFGKT